LNIVGSGALDCDAPEDDGVVAALLDTRDDEPDEPVPLQDVMTKMPVSISAAVARTLLTIRHASFNEPA
jgi:hypothetical protein